MSGTTPHWAVPHMSEDILATARRPGSAEPTEIHVRSAILARLMQDPVAPAAVDAQRGTGFLDGIPLVVDEDVPACPGYEVHRACGTTRPAAA
jgi:hypothetical protein